MRSNPNDPIRPAPELHARFLAILPRIEQHARIYFRHIRCPAQKEEVLAEVRGLVWKWFVRHDVHVDGMPPAQLGRALPDADALHNRQRCFVLRVHLSNARRNVGDLAPHNAAAQPHQLAARC
jgi:hypothetical protein